MSMKHTLRRIFGKRAETRDDHVDETLRTNYYRTTRDRALETIENIFRNIPDYEINSVSKDHGEISLLKVKGKKAFIVVTVIMVRPYRTAIDFSVATESILPFDFGYSSRLIPQLYEFVNRELEMIR